MKKMKILMEENESQIIHELYSQHFGSEAAQIREKQTKDIINKLNNTRRS
jgi:hypothetical protein